MTIPFRSVAEAQAFASAFSKATSGSDHSPRLSLNSTLHCLAVASKFKNWPTMKSYLEKQAEPEGLPARKFADLPQPGVMEMAALFREGDESRHYMYSSDLQVNRLRALHASVQCAKRAGLDVIVVANDMNTLKILDLDYEPLFLDTPPGPLWKMDAPISLGYCHGPSRSKQSTEDLLGPFLSNLQELQAARLEASKSSGAAEARGIHLLLEPSLPIKNQSTGSKFSKAVTEEVRRIAFWGRRLKISLGYIFDSGQASLTAEKNDLTAEVLRQSSSVHND